MEMPRSIDQEALDSPLRSTEGEAFTVPEEDARRVAGIMELLKIARMDMNTHFAEIELCLEYVNGDCIVLRDIYTGEIQRLRTSEGRIMQTRNNVLRPVNRTLVSKLCRFTPSFQVERATTDYEELFAARACEALLKYVFTAKSLKVVYGELMEKVTQVGDAFLYPEWSMDVGRPISFCPKCDFKGPAEGVGQPCPQCEAQMQQQMAAASIPMEPGMMPDGLAEPGVEGLESEDSEGEVPVLQAGHSGGVALEVYAPWEVFPEPNIKDVDKMGYVILVKRMPVHEARRRYPEFARFIHNDSPDVHTDAFKFMSSAPPYQSKECVVYKYVERGTELTPQGRTIHIVNDMIVREDVNGIFDLLQVLPVCHFGFERDLKSRSIWSRPWILDGHHRQRELNYLESLFREYVTRQVRFKLLAPLGCRIQEEEVTSPKMLLQYTPGIGKPEPMQMQHMPQEVFARRADVIADIRNLSGTTEAEAGVMSDPNGRAAAIMQAESAQQMSPILQRIFAQWIKMAYIILAMYQRYSDPDELFTTTGGENPETFAMQDVKLTPGFDICVEVEDGLSTNQAIRLNQAAELANIGQGILFIDPDTGVFDTAAFGNYAKLKLPNLRPDIKQCEFAAAMQLIKRIEKGDPTAMPQPEDDPSIFQLVCVQWLRGTGRRRLMKNPQDPVVQAIRQLYGMYATLLIQAKLNTLAGGGAEPQPGSESGGNPEDQGPRGQESGAGAKPGGAGNPIAQEAGATVKNADAAAESAARVQQKHEG